MTKWGLGQQGMPPAKLGQVLHCHPCKLRKVREFVAVTPPGQPGCGFGQVVGLVDKERKKALHVATASGKIMEDSSEPETLPNEGNNPSQEETVTRWRIGLRKF